MVMVGLVVRFVVRFVVWLVMGLVVVWLVMRLVVGFVVVLMLMARVGNMSNIAFIAINIVIYCLGAAIWKKNMVLSRGVMTISLLVVPKMDLMVIIFHCIAILVIGRMVLMVLLVVISQSYHTGDSNQDK